MVEFQKFEQLDDEAFFAELVTDHFSNGWREVTDNVGLSPVVDADRVKFAFNTYKNNLNEITIRLDSKNPDHYKRTACLLDALNRAEVIQDYETDEALVSALQENSVVGLSFADCEYRLKFIQFYTESGNQLMAFDLAYRCCQTYETQSRPYSPNYLESMVHYLCENADKNVASLYMIFKSYWI